MTWGSLHARLTSRVLKNLFDHPPVKVAMGMPVFGVTSNRDEPRSTHMNVDLGGGVSIAFFDFPHVERLKVPAPEEVGGMMHVAIPISPERYDEVEGRFKERGVPHRRIGDSVYLKDPNGMTIELIIA